jgi:hypothetical protein
MSTNDTEDGSATNDEAVLLRLHLRGGQTVEKVVVDWGVEKSNITGELTKLTWKGWDGDKSRMPFVRVDAVDAITVAAVPES